MNILIINHYAGSINMGMEFRPYYFAKEWIKLGHKVEIIAGDYSHLRHKNPEVAEDFQVEEIEGIRYHWIITGKYNGNGLKRAFTMFRFVRKLYVHASKIAKELNPDVVIASSTYPLDTFPAQRIAKKANAKLIHEVHDMWPATLIELGQMSKKNPFVVLMQIAENSAYRHSDRVVSLLPCSKEYMVRHGMKPSKFIHIANGISKEEWNIISPISEEHRKLFIKLRNEGKFIIGYFGGHALSNALGSLLETASRLEDKSVSFVLVGNGIEKENLQTYAKKRNLDNVYFLPSVPKNSVPDLVQYFDSIYIGVKKSPLYRFGICMNKLFDSMMAAKPILYAVDAPNNYVEEYKCGFTVEPENIDEYCVAIKKMCNLSFDERKVMGENGRNAVLENFEYKFLAEKFINIMSEKGI